MTFNDKAQYVDNMPYEMFEALIGVENEANKAYQRTNEIMVGVNQQRPSDNRGFTRSVLNRSVVITCLQRKESLLTTKMVSLNIIFANPMDNPNYFKEICEVFSKKSSKTGERILEYVNIANAYNTTVENVKSNILFTEYKDKMAEISNKNIQTK